VVISHLNKRTEYEGRAIEQIIHFVLYSPDTPVPIPKDAKVLKVPADHLDPEQIKLAFAHGDSPGGYKVPILIGLSWTAPYLHDGGVSVGPNNELGVAGTLLKGVVPDPRNSLRKNFVTKSSKQMLPANSYKMCMSEASVIRTGLMKQPDLRKKNKTRS
jgi:hypothetical protein